MRYSLYGWIKRVTVVAMTAAVAAAAMAVMTVAVKSYFDNVIDERREKIVGTTKLKSTSRKWLINTFAQAQGDKFDFSIQ